MADMSKAVWNPGSQLKCQKLVLKYWRKEKRKKGLTDGRGGRSDTARIMACINQKVDNIINIIIAFVRACMRAREQRWAQRVEAALGSLSAQTELRGRDSWRVTFQGKFNLIWTLTMMRHLQLVVDCGEFFFLSFFISFFGRDRWLSFGFSVFGAHGISMLNSPNEDYKRNVSDKVLLSDLLKYPPSPLEELGTTEFASSHFDKRTFTHNTLLQTCPNVQSHLSYLRLIQPLSTRSCCVHRLIQHKW